MKAIIKRELKNYFKNPLYWIGLAVISLMLYQILRPYLDIRYFESEEELNAVNPENSWDGDIMEGYIPSTPEQQMELGYEELRLLFTEEFGIPAEESEQIIEEMRSSGMTIDEAAAYLESKLDGFLDSSYYFEKNEIHKGNLEEVNQYIRECLTQQPFSHYFAEKFADFGGLFMGFFSSILLLFLFLRDTRKDMYELLHTKPVTAASYVCGKIAGGFFAALCFIGILTLLFDALCFFSAKNHGFPVRLWDLPLAVLVYIVPNLLMVTCVYALVSLLFKTPLPAVPLLILYMLYSNMGKVGPDGNFGYYGRALAIMVRFPGRFFEISPPPMVYFNQLFLLFASALTAFVSVLIWKRRRVY